MEIEETLQKMHACVEEGNTAGAVYILERNPALGIQLYEGRMIAHAAAAAGLNDLVWYLSEHRTELLYLQDGQGNVPAHLAAQNGHLDAFLFIHQYAPSSMAIRNKNRSGAFPGGECVSDCCAANPVLAPFAKVAKAEEEDIRAKVLADLPDEMKQGECITYGNVEAGVSRIPELWLKKYCQRFKLPAPEARRCNIAQPTLLPH